MGTKVVAVVQARLDSTRLPGKVLAPVEGRPMLAHVVARLRRCKRVGTVVVAVPSGSPEIGKAVRLAGAELYPHRGDPADVLGRYVAAARFCNADIVVRVTADCPLIDPGTVDRVVGTLLAEPRADYAANVIERTYPDGLDVEAFWLDTLLRLDRHATEPADREHVTRLLLRRGQPLFTALSLTTAPNRGHWRWTVDTQADLDYVRLLYQTTGGGLPYEELAALIEQGRVPLRTQADEARRTREAA